MKKKELSPFERDTVKRIEGDSEFSDVFFEELVERPLSVQLSMLRKLNGISQVQLANRARLKQSFLSKLEKEDSDHLISVYEKVAKILQCRLALIPEGSKVIPPKDHLNLRRAA
jgi:DNA-binding XRE family transcriptional regulator